MINSFRRSAFEFSGYPCRTLSSVGNNVTVLFGCVWNYSFASFHLKSKLKLSALNGIVTSP